MAQVTADTAGLDRERSVIEEVYRRRARRIAERKHDVESAAALPALVFRLGAERYGIELSHLVEILPYRHCTDIPGGPGALLGVINLRGDIRAVADSRRLLGLPEGDGSDKGYIVMVRHESGVVGLKVDSVEGVRDVAADELSATDGDAASRFLKAITADGVIVIDTRAALSSIDS